MLAERFEKGTTDEQKKRYLSDVIKYYYTEKESFDGHKKSFEVIKDNFENDMELLFDKYANDDGELKVKMSGDFANIVGLKVKKVQQASSSVIVTEVKKLDASVRKKVLKTKYTVVDLRGLLRYLKEIGVNYSDVKKFITCSEVADEAAFNQLYELGEISPEEAEKCVKITLKKPWYRLTPINAAKRNTIC